MKKLVIALAVMIFASPVWASGRHGGSMGHPGVHVGRPPVGIHVGVNVRPPVHHHYMGHRPPVRMIYRPGIPLYNAYYGGGYYYGVYPGSYGYYPTTTTTTYVNGEVVVRESTPYAEINTAANLLNAVANTATAIKVLSW